MRFLSTLPQDDLAEAPAAARAAEAAGYDGLDLERAGGPGPPDAAVIRCRRGA